MHEQVDMEPFAPLFRSWGSEDNFFQTRGGINPSSLRLRTPIHEAFERKTSQDLSGIIL
jgi:hypothetical protein